MVFFEVWTGDRARKSGVSIQDTCPDMIEGLITKASSKLNIDGKMLVLERSGTPIDDNESLLDVKENILLLLQENEVWNKSVDAVMELQAPVGTAAPLAQIPMNFTNIASVSVLAVESVNEKIFALFQIPWEKLTSGTQSALNRGDRNEEITKQCVHLVISELREIDIHVPNKILENVAQQMIHKYPDSFEDKMSDEKTRAGNGYAGMLLKLRNHLNYKNKSKNSKRSLDDAVFIPVSKRRLAQSVRAGCKNWQPITVAVDANHNQISDEDMRLKLFAFKNSNLSNDIVRGQYLKVFEESFSAQRKFLNNFAKFPDIATIKEQWPALVETIFIFDHFNRLTGRPIDDVRVKCASQIGQKLISWGVGKKFITQIEDVTDSNERIWKIVAIIHKHFKEELSALFTLLPESSPKDEIAPVHQHPHLVVIGGKEEADDNDDWEYLGNSKKKEYLLFVDKLIVQSTFNPVEGLQLLIASYFVYNRTYPQSAPCSLEFMQMYLLEIYPDGECSKSRRKANTNKVRTLIKMANSHNITE